MHVLAQRRPFLLPAVGAVTMEPDTDMITCLRWALPISAALWALIIWAVA